MSTQSMTQKTEKLATAFRTALEAELSMKQVEKMDELNRQKEEGVCHSHDFCDANMVMDFAFQQVFGREPKLDDADDTALWNAAWERMLKKSA